MRPLPTGLTVSLLLLALPAALHAESSDKPDKPNVLFIAVDDLNDWTGSLGGHPQTATPHLDRLASRGVQFTNAHCPAPLCNASRAALMSGLRPSTTGVYTNQQPLRKARPDVTTLPQHLMNHGYTALGAGKIYHGRFPDPPSWDAYFPSQHTNRPADPVPDGRPLNGIPNTAHFDWGPVDAPIDAMSDAKVAAWVSKQLRKDHEKPFFLACGIYRPHLPWYVPPEFFEPLPPADEGIELSPFKKNDLADVPKIGRKIARQHDHRRVTKHDEWHEAVRGYLASIRFADAMLGRVLRSLKNSQYAESTIVVLWSDHGWHLGEKRSWRKFTLWQRSSRVVMTIAGPGIDGGARTGAPVNLLDLYPTLCELTGVPMRDHLAGRSLKPLLNDPDASWDRPTVTTFRRGNHAVSGRRYRYIRYRDGSEELYDLENDPNEWNNLAGEDGYADVKERLARHLPEKNAPNAPAVHHKWWPGKE